MEIAISLLVGYYLGTKFGPVDFDKASKAWQEINESKEGKVVLEGVTDILALTVQQGVRTLLGLMLPKSK